MLTNQMGSFDSSSILFEALLLTCNTIFGSFLYYFLFGAFGEIFAFSFKCSVFFKAIAIIVKIAL